MHSVFKGVVAYVEVRSGNDNRSAAISQELRQLGAQVEANFTDSVTHVVFKEGMKRTWNKAVKRKVPMVSVSWIDSCKQNQSLVPVKEFVASRPEEVSSPLPRINQAVRWKKMKSMQPCDFNEELARSAERCEKKRKRVMMANRFTLNEESTPTLSSPIPILAFETQARSPLLAAASRTTSSPVPDTPSSLQKRLEKMREQNLDLEINFGDSPTATPKAPIDKQLQRRLFDALSSDFMSIDSSNDEDEETSTKTVAELINGLESNSEHGSQSSGGRKGHEAAPKLLQDVSRPANTRQSTPSQLLMPACSSLAGIDDGSSPDKAKVLQASKKMGGSGRLSLNESINPSSPMTKHKTNPEDSPRNNENVRRRSQLPNDSWYLNSKRVYSMSNALSPKDTNINSPTATNISTPKVTNISTPKVTNISTPKVTNISTPKVTNISTPKVTNISTPKRPEISNPCLNGRSPEPQHTPGKMCPITESRLVKTFLNSDCTDRTSVTGGNDHESSKTLGCQGAAVVDGEESLVGPHSRRSVSRRLSSRLLLNSRANSGLTSVLDCCENTPSPAALQAARIRQVGKSVQASESGTNKPTSAGNDGSKPNVDVLRKCGELVDSTSLEPFPTEPLRPVMSKKKRNLLAETALSSLLCSTKTNCHEQSSSATAVSSHKTLDSSMKSDIFFMFGTTKPKNTEKESNAKLKRRISKSTKTSTVHLPSSEMNANNVPNIIPITSDSLCKAAVVSNTTVSRGQQNHSSIGDSVLSSNMSMSIMYGNDTSISNTTKTCTSRRSLDEFSIVSRAIGRARKHTKTSAQNSNDTLPKKGDEAKRRTNGNTQKAERKLKRQRSTSSSSISVDKKTAKKSKECVSPLSTDNDNTCNDSTLSHQDSLTPVRLRHAQSLVMEQRIQPLLKRATYSLVVTSLHRDEQEIVYSVVKKLGLFHLTNNVEATSTHVVCGEPRRTLNVLKAVARGCWLLRKEWVLESLEAGMWLHEEPYEMTDFPAAVKSRSERHEAGPGYKADLFSKLGCMFVSAACTPPRQEIVQMINLCCGHVTGSETRAAIHLGDNHDPAKLVIKPAWVLDCIMKLQILPTDDYIVFPKALDSQRESSPEF